MHTDCPLPCPDSELIQNRGGGGEGGRERERQRQRQKQTDKQTYRRRNKQSLAYLSQLLHLVGADVRAVSESKIEEEEEEEIE